MERGLPSRYRSVIGTREATRGTYLSYLPQEIRDLSLRYLASCDYSIELLKYSHSAVLFIKFRGQTNPGTYLDDKNNVISFDYNEIVKNLPAFRTFIEDTESSFVNVGKERSITVSRSYAIHSIDGYLVVYYYHTDGYQRHPRTTMRILICQELVDALWKIYDTAVSYVRIDDY